MINGFPRRIHDYSSFYFKFQWFNPLGLIGIYLSITILLFVIIYSFLSLYLPFLTFSYINILGFLSFIVFLSQLSSGILSSIYYNDFFTIASDPIITIIININNGWFIRILVIIYALS